MLVVRWNRQGITGAVFEGKGQAKFTVNEGLNSNLELKRCIIGAVSREHANRAATDLGGARGLDCVDRDS